MPTEPKRTTLLCPFCHPQQLNRQGTQKGAMGPPFYYLLLADYAAGYPTSEREAVCEGRACLRCAKCAYAEFHLTGERIRIPKRSGL